MLWYSWMCSHFKKRLWGKYNNLDFLTLNFGCKLLNFKRELKGLERSKEKGEFALTSCHVCLDLVKFIEF